MDKPARIQPADLLVALKLAASPKVDLSVRDLAEALGMSKSAVALSLNRLEDRGIIHTAGGKRRIRRMALRGCLEHAVQWIAPAVIGDWELGLPTAHAFELLASKLHGDQDPVIIPLPHGPMRGRAVTPLDPRAPRAAKADPNLHRLLAIVDALRIGRARDREIAALELRAWV